MPVSFRFTRCSAGLFCLLGGGLLPDSLALAETAVQSEEAHKEKKEAPKASVAPSKQENLIVKARRREQMLVKSGGQLGVLGNKKGLDVPFSIHSYTSSLILNQQSQTLGQVLQNDPAVRTTYGYGNFSELFVIRGFPVYGDDVSINGLYGITPRQLVSPQLYDQVQLLTGASAFLNGAAPGGTSIGGTINLQFKHADDDPLLRLTGDYTSSAMGGGSVDMSRRFGDHKAFGVRLNVAGMSGQTSIEHERRHSTALGFDTDWHDDKTRISLDMNYQNQGVQQGRPGLLLGSGLTATPRPVAPAHNYGQPWTYTELNYIFGMLNVEHDLNKHLTFYGAFGGMSSDEKGNYGSPTVNNAQTGDATTGFLYVPYRQTNESTHAGVRAHFRTGPLKHEMNAGGSGLWEDTATAYSFASSTASNIYNTQNFAQPTPTWYGGDVKNPKTINTVRLYSLFFSDTVSVWHDRIALTGGFRFQNIRTKSFGYNSRALESQYDQNAITPVVGLVVHPTKHSALFFNRTEGLSPGPQAGSTYINSGQIFAPYRTEQYEIGAKYDIGTLSTSLAFYRMTQPNAYGVPVGNTGQALYTMDGRQRNQGIEFSLHGQIIKGLRFNGGTSITQAVQRRTSSSATQGKKAVGIPSYTINGNIEYDLPFIKGGTLTGRVTHTGPQWVNATNTQRVKTWTSFDLGARYTFLATHRHPMTMRFGVENLANTRYWASAYGGYLTEGMPRTFKFSLSTDL
ncbi:TonB-dependent receptor [Saccharibacter floricola]|uniref:TonB-dependent receptor n=1 Tax=Saccharibacter floricola TaxID=231053 RepID=UPI000376B0FE|nr:TonB-dependent receptor [Saccharibacter floricola]